MKTLIIDFGGVLYDIDIQRTISGFKSRSLLKDFDVKLKGTIKDLVMPYEKGIISSDEFRKGVCEHLSIELEDDEFDVIWNSTLIGKKGDIEEIVLELKKIAPIYLLSNTNEIHFDHFIDECSQLFSVFDKCYFSFKIGFVKPEPEIYRFVMNDIEAHPSDLIMLDDSLENLNAARSLGIDIQHINDSFKLSDFLHTVNIY